MTAKLLSFFAATSILAVVVGVCFDAFVLGLFGVAVSVLLVLIAQLDYAPRRRARCRPCCAPAAESWPLAC